MNILINCSNIKIGGGIQVSASFLTEISKNETHNFTIVVSSTLKKHIKQETFSKRHSLIEYDISAGVMSSVFSSNKFLDRLVLDNRVERVFTVFGPSYWKPKVKHICGFAKSQYIYLDSPFFRNLSLSELFTLKLKRFFHLYSFNKTSDILITELWDVSKKLKDIFPRKDVFTVTNTYNQIFKNEELWNKTSLLPEFEGTTLITISANYPHKNLQIIPKVILCLRNKYEDFKFRFVLTLDEKDLAVENKDILENLVFTGKVKIDQCPSLYRVSDFMFMPTLLECFSATYPEAMIMQTPVLTSDLPFARSICGEAAEYFDPLNPKEIAEKIYALSLNTEKQDQLKSLGLKRLDKFDTPKSRAEKYLEIITEK